MTRRLPPEVEAKINLIVLSGTVGDLRAAILAACDAAERRGIERAATLVAGNHLLSMHIGPLFGAGWQAANKAGADAIRALPVPEEGANG